MPKIKMWQIINIQNFQSHTEIVATTAATWTVVVVIIREAHA